MTIGHCACKFDSMLSQQSLAQLVGVPVGTVASWEHRGVVPKPERPGGYGVAEALCLAILVDAMRAGRTVETARAEVAWKVPLLGHMATAMVRDGRMPSATKIIFVKAEFEDDEEPWHRLVLSTADRERLVAAALRRSVHRLTVDDFTRPYLTVLAAFMDARSPQRERVTA